MLSLGLQHISVNFKFETKIARIRILFILLMAAPMLDRKWSRSQHQVNLFHKNRYSFYFLKLCSPYCYRKTKISFQPIKPIISGCRF